MVFFISWSCMELHSKETSHKSIPQFSPRHVLEWVLMQSDPLSKQWVPSVSFRFVDRWPWKNEFLCSWFSLQYSSCIPMDISNCKREILTIWSQIYLYMNPVQWLYLRTVMGRKDTHHSWKFCLADS